VAEQLVDTTEGKYQVGETWSYRTRPGEEGSFVTVLKVESSPATGVIVHLRVDGLRIDNPASPDGVSETIGHMPLAEQAVDASVTARLSGGAPVVGPDEGYWEWRRAFEAGEAGVWTVTVAEAVDSIAHVLGS
jgi:hypothetical protein